MFKQIGKSILNHSPKIVRKLSNRLVNSEIGYRIFKASFWSFLNTVFIRGFGLLSTIIVARIIGKEGYGELGIINSTIGLFGTFAGFGLSITTIKFVAEFQKSDPCKTGKIITLTNIFAISFGLIVSLIFFLMADWLALETLSTPAIASKLKMGSLLIIFYTWNGVQVGTLSGYEAFKQMTKIGAVIGISNLPLMVGGAYLYGVNGIIVGMLLSQMLGGILYLFEIRKQNKKRNIPSFTKHFWDERYTLISFSLPSFLSGMIIGPVNWIANAFLVKAADGMAEMGIYSAIERISTISLSIMTPISHALLPIFISKLSESNKKLDILNINISWILGLFIILPILTFPEFSGFLFGNDFKGPGFQKALIAAMLSAAILAHRQGIARSFIAKSYLWLSVASNTFWGILVVITSYFLVNYGAEGRSFSVLIAYFINTIIFIPIYIKLNLAPKESLYSKEAIVIWLGVLTLGVLSYFNIHIALRSLSLVFIVIIIIKMFKNLTAIQK